MYLVTRIPEKLLGSDAYMSCFSTIVKSPRNPTEIPEGLHLTTWVTAGRNPKSPVGGHSHPLSHNLQCCAGFRNHPQFQGRIQVQCHMGLNLVVAARRSA